MSIPKITPKLDMIAALISALLVTFMPLAAAASEQGNPGYWVNGQWASTAAMLDTLDILHTVNVEQLEQVSSIPISQMLQQKAAMNEVVQQLESLPQQSALAQP